jgi:hypothetical protein
MPIALEVAAASAPTNLTVQQGERKSPLLHLLPLDYHSAKGRAVKALARAEASRMNSLRARIRGASQAEAAWGAKEGT